MRKLKIAFGMIVFNGDFVLKQVLDSVYPYASQILISEGCVGYWKNKGFTTSTDSTNDVLTDYKLNYDPENKVIITHGTYPEKTEQANAYMRYLNEDIDYIWNLDSDEVFKPEDIEKVISLLQTEQYTSVGFKSCTFYGGFNHILTGFERNAEFLRIQKVYPGSQWWNHRPPTICHAIDRSLCLQEKHLDFNTLWNKHKVQMYHYSYVFPRQVHDKVAYYKAAVSQDNCIDEYFTSVYLPWVNGDDSTKWNIENKYLGVHEFKPRYRGSCTTERNCYAHPQIIVDSLDQLWSEFNSELDFYNRKYGVK